MKNAIFATGAALVIAVLLSSPTFAQTPNKRATEAAPAPAANIEQAARAEPPSTTTSSLLQRRRRAPA